jgi:hypothetical protein
MILPIRVCISGSLCSDQIEVRGKGRFEADIERLPCFLIPLVFTACHILWEKWQYEGKKEFTDYFSDLRSALALHNKFESGINTQ